MGAAEDFDRAPRIRDQRHNCGCDPKARRQRFRRHERQPEEDAQAENAPRAPLFGLRENVERAPLQVVVIHSSGMVDRRQRLEAR